MGRRRSRKRKNLEISEIIDICHKVLIQGEYQHIVAKEFRTTQGAISNVVRNALKDPDIFKKHLSKREEKQEKKQAIKRTVKLMYARHIPLETS